MVMCCVSIVLVLSEAVIVPVIENTICRGSPMWLPAFDTGTDADFRFFLSGLWVGIGIEYIFIPIVSPAPYSEPDTVAQTRIDPRAAAEHRRLHPRTGREPAAVRYPEAVGSQNKRAQIVAIE